MISIKRNIPLEYDARNRSLVSNLIQILITSAVYTALMHNPFINRSSLQGSNNYRLKSGKVYTNGVHIFSKCILCCSSLHKRNKVAVQISHCIVNYFSLCSFTDGQLKGTNFIPSCAFLNILSPTKHMR
jgi:hypothetical protein